MKLTSKQESFARYYVANRGNATQAAIDAKYSKRTATEIGAENLTKPHIAEFIESLKEPIRKELGVTAEWVRKQLKVEATLKKEDGATHAGRIRALELLGKDVGMFTETVAEREDVIWSVNIKRVDIGDDGTTPVTSEIANA